MFKALQTDTITLHLINDDNVAYIRSMLEKAPDSEEIITEMMTNYLPKFDGDGQRTNYGFYVIFENELAGLTLFTVDNWREKKGSTGADMLPHMRGKGITPASKTHLFYLAFEMLGLNRVETGCFISNHSSQRSIEKTPGFQYEGITRESDINEKGEFEDERLYAILRRDWVRLYDKSVVRVIY